VHDGCPLAYSELVAPTPALENPVSAKRSFLHALGWGTLAMLGGGLIYLVFATATGMEPSLVGIPAGLAVGQIVYWASGKKGGRRDQVQAVFLAFVSFALTYASGMEGIAFKRGITVFALAFFAFMTIVSPLIDPQNWPVGAFMVVAGMYLAWVSAGTRRQS